MTIARFLVSIGILRLQESAGGEDVANIKSTLMKARKRLRGTRMRMMMVVIVGVSMARVGPFGLVCRGMKERNMIPGRGSFLVILCISRSS